VLKFHAFSLKGKLLLLSSVDLGLDRDRLGLSRGRLLSFTDLLGMLFDPAEGRGANAAKLNQALRP
jgi:hypothetical protein